MANYSWISLTPAEERVVRAVMKGYVKGKELGDHLKITQGSLVALQQNIYNKTGARNLVELVLMVTGRIEQPPNLKGIEKGQKHYG